MSDLKEEFDRAVERMNKDFAEIKKKINISTPNIPNGGAGGASGASGTGATGNAGNGGGNTTINNTTYNNNSTGDTNIDNSTGNVTINNRGGGRGGSSANSGNNGVQNGSNGQGKDGGNCENAAGTVGCTPMGSLDDAESRIAEHAKGAGDGLEKGIGRKEIDFGKVGRAGHFIESGSCPASKSFQFMGTNHEISYHYMCDIAVKIRPFMIFCAVFISFMMVYAAVVNNKS